MSKRFRDAPALGGRDIGNFGTGTSVALDRSFVTGPSTPHSSATK